MPKELDVLEFLRKDVTGRYYTVAEIKAGIGPSVRKPGPSVSHTLQTMPQVEESTTADGIHCYRLKDIYPDADAADAIESKIWAFLHKDVTGRWYTVAEIEAGTDCPNPVGPGVWPDVGMILMTMRKDIMNTRELESSTTTDGMRRYRLKPVADRSPS